MPKRIHELFPISSEGLLMNVNKAEIFRKCLNCGRGRYFAYHYLAPPSFMVGVHPDAECVSISVPELVPVEDDCGNYTLETFETTALRLYCRHEITAARDAAGDIYGGVGTKADPFQNFWYAVATASRIAIRTCLFVQLIVDPGAVITHYGMGIDLSCPEEIPHRTLIVGELDGSTYFTIEDYGIPEALEWKFPIYMLSQCQGTSTDKATLIPLLMANTQYLYRAKLRELSYTYHSTAWWQLSDYRNYVECEIGTLDLWETKTTIYDTKINACVSGGYLFAAVKTDFPVSICSTGYYTRNLFRCMTIHSCKIQNTMPDQDRLTIEASCIKNSTLSECMVKLENSSGNAILEDTNISCNIGNWAVVKFRSHSGYTVIMNNVSISSSSYSEFVIGIAEEGWDGYGGDPGIPCIINNVTINMTSYPQIESSSSYLRHETLDGVAIFDYNNAKISNLNCSLKIIPDFSKAEHYALECRTCDIAHSWSNEPRCKVGCKIETYQNFEGASGTHLTCDRKDIER